MRDDDLLPDLKRQGVSDAAIEKLAPTALFRVVIDAKYVSARGSCSTSSSYASW